MRTYTLEWFDSLWTSRLSGLRAFHALRLVLSALHTNGCRSGIDGLSNGYQELEEMDTANVVSQQRCVYQPLDINEEGLSCFGVTMTPLKLARAECPVWEYLSCLTDAPILPQSVLWIKIEHRDARRME